MPTWIADTDGMFEMILTFRRLRIGSTSVNSSFLSLNSPMLSKWQRNRRAFLQMSV